MDIVDRKKKIANFTQALTYWPIYGFLRVFFRYKVEGQDNLEGLSDGPIIFASNHASYIDGPVSAASMPRIEKEWYPNKFFPIQFLVIDRFFKWLRHPFAALYVHTNGSLKVVKGTGLPLNVVLDDVIQSLENNSRIWIYPEGGITQDGKLGQGRRGVAFLHQTTHAPVVPVALNGTYNLWKRDITVVIGKPIYDLGNVSPEEGVKTIMQEIKKLLKK